MLYTKSKYNFLCPNSKSISKNKQNMIGSKKIDRNIYK